MSTDTGLESEVKSLDNSIEAFVTENPDYYTRLAFMGMWEMSIITVALIGAGAFLCIIIGIPLGIWFAKSRRAYNFAEPVLDFMQTMPAFVYLIPNHCVFWNR